MRKRKVLLVVIMLAVLASATAMAGQGGNKKGMIETKAGTLFLFQKCDALLAEQDPEAYDALGCPTADGPWPILPTKRWGQMKYNLLGDKFRFSFEGKKLVPNTDYTLVYYPDPWPGENLICLGSRTSNDAGNLQINGCVDIPKGLPVPEDENYSPKSPSGAVGAKIWLVRAADVDCVGIPAADETTEESAVPAVPPQMIGWTPQDYLFEGNLIIYQYEPPRDCCRNK